MTKALGWVAAVVFMFAVTGASAAEPAVKDTSFRDHDGHRIQQVTVVLNVSVEKVWHAFTTDEGYTRWAVPVAHIDLRNDGIIESSYLLEAKIGNLDNIQNQIVAFLPNRLIVLKTVRVPPGAPFDPVLIGNIRTIVEFIALDGGKTKIVLSGVGYGEGPGYDSMYGHFRNGNAAALRSLVQSLTTGPVDWRVQAERLKGSLKEGKGSND